MLDTKTVIILAFATYTFGPRLMLYLAKVAQAMFMRIGSDAKDNISQWASARLKLILQALILKLSVGTAQQTVERAQELPAAAHVTSPEPAPTALAPPPVPAQSAVPVRPPAAPPDETTEAVPPNLASKPVVGMHRQQVPMTFYRAPRQPQPTAAAAERMRNLQIAEANNLRREVDRMRAQRAHHMQLDAGDD